MERAGGVDRHAVEDRAHLGVARHMSDVQAHVRDVEHVVAAERIPRVHHAVVAARDVDARGEQLLDARHAAALGVHIVPPLQRDVDQRVGDGRHLRLVHERDELRHVVVVHGVHGREVRADDAALQAMPDRLASEDLDVARERIVRFVTMHVHQQAALGGDTTEPLDRGRAVGHRPLEVRNAADDVDAEVERLREPGFADGRAQEAILGERDQLQIDLALDELAHLEQRLHRAQRRIAHVDVTADRQRATRHGPAAQLERALADLVVGQRRLELAPQLDALQQRAGAVHARPPIGQRRVHVEVRIDERRRDQAAGGIDDPPRLRDGVAGDRDDPAALAGDRHAAPAVGEDGVAQDQIKHAPNVQPEPCG